MIIAKARPAGGVIMAIEVMAITARVRELRAAPTRGVAPTAIGATGVIITMTIMTPEAMCIKRDRSMCLNGMKRAGVRPIF